MQEKEIMLLSRDPGRRLLRWGWKRMKLKRTGDTETFQDEAARQTKSSLNLYLSFVAVFEAYLAGWGWLPPHSSTGWKRCGWLCRGSRGVWWGHRNRVHRGSQLHTEEKPGLRRTRELCRSDSIYTGNRGSSIGPDLKPPLRPRKSLPAPRSSTQSAPRSLAAGLSVVDPRPRCSPDWWTLDSISVCLCHWECLPESQGLECWCSFPRLHPDCALWWSDWKEFDPAPPPASDLLLAHLGGHRRAAGGREQSLFKSEHILIKCPKPDTKSNQLSIYSSSIICFHSSVVQSEAWGSCTLTGVCMRIHKTPKSGDVL